MSTARITANDIVKDHLGGKNSCEQTIRRVFERLPLVQETCNPFTEWFEEEALEKAQALDRKVNVKNVSGLLHGVPICIKDMTPTKGHHTTCGSWSTGDGVTDHDAVIVQRLLAAGAIVIGKTTTAELAFSSFTNTKRYGVTRNPWNPNHTSGGSSGGSAVAVASGLVPLAEGSDMGGSVRIPASACGVVGFKPSLGRIPMDILPAAFETLSHFGPLAASVSDAALFVAATAGHHPCDMLSTREPFDHGACGPKSLKGLKFALSIDLGFCEVDPEIAAALHRVADTLRDQGAIVCEIALPWSREIYDQWAVRWYCLLSLFANTSSPDMHRRMNPDLVACIDAAHGFTAMDLMKVDVFRAKLNRQMNDVLSEYDVLLCPTNAVPAPLATHTDADYEMTLDNGKFRAFDMANPFNMVPTSPVLSLPIGLTKNHLPIGMQIIGRPHENEAVLSISASIEALTDPLPIPNLQPQKPQ